MPQANFDATITQLQNEIQVLQNKTTVTTRAEVITTIEKTHALLTMIAPMAKPSRALQTFFEIIAQATAEIYQVAISIEEEPNVTRPRAILQHLSSSYQETIVPMLTRLNNLATETEEMQKITNLAYLGNEIMSCANQIYQFSEKINLTEKIYGMLGTLLMMAGVGLTILVLSIKNPTFEMATALTIITVGCVLCRLAIIQHDTDPEVDLARKAVNTTEKAIHNSKELLLGPQENTLNGTETAGNAAPVEVESKPKKAKKTTAAAIRKEIEPPAEDIVDKAKEHEVTEPEVKSNNAEKPSGLKAKFLSAIGFMKSNNKE